jgi:CubicO group peptidase (beta-lactamase class C family)
VDRLVTRLTFAALVGAAPGSAAPLAAQGDVIAAARARITDSMTAAGVPGVSVTVLRNGVKVWSEGLGFADVEQRVRVTPLTRFRIGSVSKSLTAAAVGLLVEAGRLDLDAPVQRYVPDFPVKRYPITTRQVAGHIAGIRHYRGDEFGSMRRYATVTDGLAIFRDDSLEFEPGTRYRYSSYGWNLMSAVVEGASGVPFLDYMRTRVFRPLGLRQIVADHPDSIISFRARWYTGPRDSLRNAPYVDPSYKWAGGGFLSNTEDLAVFGHAMLTDRLLRRGTFEMLTTSQRISDGTETGYGIGWAVSRDAAGRRRVMHSGGSTGGTAYLILYPDQGLVVAMLANSDQPFIGIARSIAEFFAGALARPMPSGM